MTTTITGLDLAAWASALDRLDPPAIDVFGKLEYTPTPKQQMFHDATEFDVLFGGSLGGGKTRALTMEAIRACVRYPGIRVGAFRRTYGELKESLLAELMQINYAAAVRAKWNGSDYELRFPNGSLIMFRYAESMQDATRRQGGQYQLLIFDERTLTPPDVVSFLESRLRSGRATIPVLGIRSSANPGGPGHGRVRVKYVDATNYGTKIVHDERGRTIRFIPSRMEDNPHLNPEYENDLLALPEVLRRALREGDWGVFSGQVFSELSHSRHVIGPVELPLTWLRYNGIDWGYAKPWGVLWAAVDEDGRVWVYRELYEVGVGEAEQAKRILAAESEDEHVAVRYADDAMWATRGDAKPIADVYGENGVHLTQAGKGAGSRIIGWQRVHSYLDDGPACSHHRAMGWDKCPMIHIFPQVENLFRELRDLPHATKGDPEDADTTASDHACLVAGTLVVTRRGEVPIELVTTRDEVMTCKGWRRVRAAGLTGVDQPVTRISTSAGRSFTATGSHPVWAVDRGWVRVDALRYQDRLVTWSSANQSCSTGSPTGAIPTQIEDQTGSTSPPEGHTEHEASGESTRKYGKPNTETSLTATTSTTATRTRSTTHQATLLACLAWITCWSTALRVCSRPNSPLHMLRLWLKLLNGIAAMRAGNGTENTGVVSGKPDKRTLSPVSGVGNRSAQGTANPAPDSAPTSTGRTPGKLAGWMTKTASVMAAASRTESTGMQKRGRVPVRVVKRCDAGRADVYNLTVEGEPEFFANGVLVHNCDALRYLLVNLGTAPRFHFPKPQTEATELDPTATGPRPPQPLPTMYGGFPVQTEGTSIWG